MQAVNQLSRPTGHITSNPDFNQARKTKSAKPNFLAYRYTTAVVIYVVIAATMITLTYLDNGYLLKETITSIAVVGLLLVLRLFGRDVKDEVPTSKAK